MENNKKSYEELTADLIKAISGTAILVQLDSEELRSAGYSLGYSMAAFIDGVTAGMQSYAGVIAAKILNIALNFVLLLVRTVQTAQMVHQHHVKAV